MVRSRNYIASPAALAEFVVLIGTRGKVPICGTINRTPFTSTLIPRGNGEHHIVLGKEIRERIDVKVGDEIKLTVWKDDSKREVSVPNDFEAILSNNSEANVFWGSLANSYKKGYVDWINGAKKESTRTRRIPKSVTLLTEGKKLR